MEKQRTSRTREPLPFLELSHVHESLKEQLLGDFSSLIDTGAFTNGPHVATFERAFAEYCGGAFCVGVASGLDALRLALVAADVAPGEEVVVPAMTFVATFEAVTQTGGRPIVVDVDERDYNMATAATAAAMTPRTRVFLPVHLYGQLADMRSLTRIAASAGVAIVEDACQAHGAARDGMRAGTSGRAGAFSFYPGKNLGAMGDAGALVTDDETLAVTVRALCEHGQTAKYDHALEGYTARLDTMQALVLLRKLPMLDAWNKQRAAVAAFYSESLDGVGDVRVPPVPAGSEPVWHLYPVRTADPARLGDFLAERGVATGRHYPQPPHLSPAYACLGYARGDFPVAEALARELLSLPIFPGISDVQTAAVVESVREFFDRG